MASTARRVPPTAVAWVESPLQLLTAVEAHHAGLLGERTWVVPRQAMPSLAATYDALRRVELPPGVEVGSERRLPPRLAGRRRERARVVVGDPLSGVAQVWMVSSARPVVVVDDGLATIDFLHQLVSAAPGSMVRSRGTPIPRHRVGLGHLARWRCRRLADRGGLDVFTAVPVPAELRGAVEDRGARITEHRFGWLRSLPPTEPPDAPTIVLGSSLVANGLVAPDPYTEWVRELTAEHPVAYFPHRREDESTLGPLRREPGITMLDPAEPVELRLRSLSNRHQVWSLPSTAVVSLRAVLADTGADVRAMPVPNEWWTARASGHVRGTLNGAMAVAGGNGRDQGRR